MRRLLLFPLLLTAAAALAQAAHPDTTAVALVAPDASTAASEPAPAAVAPAGLTAQPWYRPHHLIGQVAAGQGMIAGGVGFTNLRGRLDVDVLAGYVPARYSITPMGIFTFKLGFSPWTLPLGAGPWQMRPLTVGGFVNYTASRGLTETRDDKYEPGYYWWPARSRAGGFVGGKLSRVVGRTRHGHPRTLGAYYELGTNDLYLTSLFTNLGGMGVHEILTLGFGVKYDL